MRLNTCFPLINVLLKIGHAGEDHEGRTKDICKKHSQICYLTRA